MQLALEFEANHFAQIRRHYQSIAPEPDHDPSPTRPLPTDNNPCRNRG